MSTETAEAPAIGHNQPPTGLLTDPEAIRQGLAERHAQLFARKDELLAGAGRMPERVDDEDAAGKVGDFIKQVNTAKSEAEKARKAEKAPYDNGGKAVQAVFKAADDELSGAKTSAEKLLNDYQRRVGEAERKRREEEARKAREEAERQAAEAQKAADDEAARQRAEEAKAEAEKAAQQAADPAPAPKTRSGYGTSVSTRKQWTFDSVDPAQIDLEALRPYLSQDALEKALRAFIKAGGREIKGARIYEDAKAVVR